jgi:hypothetical protein
MKKVLCSLSIILSMIALPSLAQRPEQMYARRGVLGLTTPVAKGATDATKAVTTTGKQAGILSTCPTCQTIPFSSFSPTSTFMSVYGADSVWSQTYTSVIPDPVWSGGYLNFDAGCINFTHYADNSFGGGFTYWDGFTVSKTSQLNCSIACNSTDCAPENQFAAVTLGGVGGANDPYVVGYDGYNDVWFQAKHTTLKLNSASNICGLYVTNSAYAYRSMNCGDWVARKFAQGDSFVLNIKGYLAGSLKPNQVNYYLADFRGTTQAYIENAWKWVNLTTLGSVDSLVFSLITSDTGPNGPNTAMYFCIDGIKIGTSPSCGTCAATDNTHNWFPMPGGNRLQQSQATTGTETWQVKVTPNPAYDQISVTAQSGGLLELYDGSGNLKLRKKLATDQTTVSLAGFRAGVYSVKVTTDKEVKTAQFLKQ